MESLLQSTFRQLLITSPHLSLDEYHRLTHNQCVHLYGLFEKKYGEIQLHKNRSFHPIVLMTNNNVTHWQLIKESFDHDYDRTNRQHAHFSTSNLSSQSRIVTVLLLFFFYRNLQPE